VEQHYLILTQFNKQNFFVHQAAEFSKIFSKIFQRFFQRFFQRNFFKPPLLVPKIMYLQYKRENPTSTLTPRYILEGCRKRDIYVAKELKNFVKF